MVEENKGELFPHLRSVENTPCDMMQNGSRTSFIEVIKLAGPLVLLFIVLAHALWKASADSYLLILL
jgi:hypothetical protein